MLLLTQSGKSFINIRTSNSLALILVELHWSTSIHRHRPPITCTVTGLPHRKYLIHFTSMSPSLSPLNFCSNIWWGTVSKAFLWFKEITEPQFFFHYSCPIKIQVFLIDTLTQTCSLLYKPMLAACCSRWTTTASLIMNFNTLRGTDVHSLTLMGGYLYSKG